MDTEKIDKKLLKQLRTLREYVDDAVEDGHVSSSNQKFNGWYGICHYCTESVKGRLAELNAQWPLSTGSYVYPVPASRDDQYDVSAAGRAFTHSYPEQMWITGEYAELRRELLDWLIKTLEETVNGQ